MLPLHVNFNAVPPPASLLDRSVPVIGTSNAAVIEPASTKALPVIKRQRLFSRTPTRTEAAASKMSREYLASARSPNRHLALKASPLALLAQSDISADTSRDDLTSVRNPILAPPHAPLGQSDVSAPPYSCESDEDVFGYSTLPNCEQPKESEASQMQDEEKAAHSSLMPSLSVQQQSSSSSTSQQLINELLEAARAEVE